MEEESASGPPINGAAERLELLPSYAFAIRIDNGETDRRGNPRKIYYTNQFCTVCEHGYTANALSHILKKESASGSTTVQPPPRKHGCDCVCTSGLNAHRERTRHPAVLERMRRETERRRTNLRRLMPDNLYEFFKNNPDRYTSRIINGRVCYRLPHFPHNDYGFLTQTSEVICQHGRTQDVINRSGRSTDGNEQARCTCQLPTIPRDTGLRGCPVLVSAND